MCPAVIYTDRHEEVEKTLALGLNIRMQIGGS